MLFSNSVVYCLRPRTRTRRVRNDKKYGINIGGGYKVLTGSRQNVSENIIIVIIIVISGARWSAVRRRKKMCQYSNRFRRVWLGSVRAVPRKPYCARFFCCDDNAALLRSSRVIVVRLFDGRGVCRAG